jgi:hypothetical protein
MANTPTITEGDLIALQLADGAVDRAKRHHEAAQADRETLRARLRRKLPKGELVKVPGTGQGIRRRLNAGGRTFSLTAYERAYGEVTPEMDSIIKTAKGSEAWSIEDIDV